MNETTLLQIEIDHQALTVPSGSTVMDAAHSIGIYIPHFCYHKKLSIAANCRMCLVQVEKAPKPLPACATPVTEGMKVWTHSELANNAQKGVMELLLINHPLDCPICDQGGECQLQDLAVGYGQSGSRYHEEKRVVTNKDFGPLIATDMTRCIHCSRCVRFSEEIAGIQELGMPGRGEHTEVMSFLGKTVDSEISGNVIDLCPVGALTSKPFRYSARNWELSRRTSISPHDGLGSNLIVQVKHHSVMRVLPLENEALNECWLSDRDRFSYEALNAQTRLRCPMLKQDGQWKSVDWPVALEVTATRLNAIAKADPERVAVLASPMSTFEELYLLRKLMAGIGVHPLEARTRQLDYQFCSEGATWLGQNITALLKNDSVLLLGSTLRHEHPLLAQRFRQAAKRGLKLAQLNPHGDSLLAPLAAHWVVRPDTLLESTLAVLQAVSERTGSSCPETVNLEGVQASQQAHALAEFLLSGEKKALLLGSLAFYHARAAQLHTVAAALAEAVGATLGFLREGANSVGADVLGFNNTVDPYTSQKQAYFLLHSEAADARDAVTARAAFSQAEFVVALTAYADEAMDYADIVLPVAPFSETPGTFLNMEGLAQSFDAVIRPLEETRPAWKVFRVLGNLLQLDGFDYENIEAVRMDAFNDPRRVGMNNAPKRSAVVEAGQSASSDVTLLWETPLYQSDAIVRRAPSLQATVDALQHDRLRANANTLASLGLVPGQGVQIKQAHVTVDLVAALDVGLLDGVLRVAQGPATASFNRAEPFTVIPSQ